MQRHPLPIMTLLLMIAGAACAQTLPSTTQSTATTRPKLVAPPRRDVPGARIDLPSGRLYIPDFFHPSADQPTHVLLFFLGASWVAEQNFFDAHRNAVLLTVKDTVWKPGFSDPAGFRAVLADVSRELSARYPGSHPPEKICLSSFSGGYTAIRDILRHPEFDPLITDVALADSLYAPRVPGHDDQLDPDAMDPFLRFARRTADGQTTFVFSHLYPPEEKYRGNTTTLAASYLIDHLKSDRQPASGANSQGAQLLYRSDLKNFHVLGYAGMTTQDHFNHFYAIADLWRLTSLPPAPLATSRSQRPSSLPFAFHASPMSSILLYWEDRHYHHSLAALLRRAGYDVVATNDADYAITVARQVPMDLLLLEIATDDAPALGLLHLLRSASIPTPAMILSDIDDNYLADTASALGVSEFILKHKSLWPALLDCIDQYIDFQPEFRPTQCLGPRLATTTLRYTHRPA